MITSGEIEQGMAISERALAERIGISRTPVREALQDLAREGIVTIHSARGAFVNPISFEEMRDLYEVRLSLEGVAAYRAAESGDHSHLRGYAAKFEGISTRAPTPDNLHLAQETGDQFHFDMFRAAGNAYLLSLYDRLRLKIALSLRMTRTGDPERVIKTVEEHLAILNAILARDPQAAQQAIDLHLRNGFEARVRIYARLQPMHVLPDLDGTMLRQNRKKAAT